MVVTLWRAHDATRTVFAVVWEATVRGVGQDVRSALEKDENGWRRRMQIAAKVATQGNGIVEQGRGGWVRQEEALPVRTRFFF